MMKKLSLITCLRNRRYLSCKIRRRQETAMKVEKEKSTAKWHKLSRLNGKWDPASSFSGHGLPKIYVTLGKVTFAGQRTPLFLLISIIHVSLLWSCQFGEWVCTIIVQHTQKDLFRTALLQLLKIKQKWREDNCKMRSMALWEIVEQSFVLWLWLTAHS